MINQSKYTDVYTDFSSLGELRSKAQKQSPEALRAAADQFEALFLQMTLKSMRSTVQKSSLFNSTESDLYSGMFDQQLALHLSSVGSMGISDLIFRQLGGDQDTASGKSFEEYLTDNRNYPLSSVARKVTDHSWSNAEEFLRILSPAASEAAKEINVSPQAILAVTALETGWGSHIIKNTNGSSSFNLFGIKATPDWHGEAAVASTLEFENGAMHKRRELFRSYSSPQESIKDFVGLIKSNPRYRAARGCGQDCSGFFEALQKAGYATDPDYSKKLNEVLGSKPMQQAFKK